VRRSGKAAFDHVGTHFTYLPQPVNPSALQEPFQIPSAGNYPPPIVIWQIYNIDSMYKIF
jgi:hypothetical protein